MIRKIMILLLVCAALDVQAMKCDNDELIEYKPCYLATIPIEIENYIAMFLDRETKEEFIKRVHPDTAPYVKDTFQTEDLLFHHCDVYCPDLRKLHILKNSDFNHDSTIFPCEYKNRIKKLTELERDMPLCFAVSEKNEFTAEITENGSYVLRVVNLTAGKELGIPLQINGFTTGLAFNKQGTKVGVFGINTEGTQEFSKIVSLKVNKKKSVVEKADKKDAHLLQNYFGKKMVCKSLVYKV